MTRKAANLLHLFIIQSQIHSQFIINIEVARVIRSFPNGSAGGPDGFRPQHLKDLTSTSAERGGRELLRALTSFVNLVLEGKTPPSVRPFFWSNSDTLRQERGRYQAHCCGSHTAQNGR